MPLRRVAPGTIPPGYEPPYLQRKKEEIEQFLKEEHRQKMFDDYMNGRREPYVEMNQPPDKKDISYRTNQVYESGRPAGDRRTPPIGIVIHHTGGNSVSGKYNFEITPDGVAHQPVPLSQYTAHMRGPDSPYRTNPNYPQLSSRNTIGIAVVGSGDGNEAQRKTLMELTRDLQQGFKIPVQNILGHGELQGGKGGNREDFEGRSSARAIRRSLAGEGNPDPALQNVEGRLREVSLRQEDLPSVQNLMEGHPYVDPEGRFNYQPRVTGQVGPGDVFTTQDIYDVAQGNSEFVNPGSSAGVPTVAGTAPGIASPGGQSPQDTSLRTSIREFFGLGPDEGGGRRGGGFATPNIKIQVPAMPGPEQEVAAFGGPEAPFPAPPPAPPRTPPGMQPPFATRRRNTFG